MDADAYFHLKSFSYYPREYSLADFDRDVAASQASHLPFRASTRAPYLYKNAGE